jgi:hypothetical protein
VIPKENNYQKKIKFLQEDLGEPWSESEMHKIDNLYQKPNIVLELNEEAFRRIIREETRPHPMEPRHGELESLMAEFDRSCTK